MKLNYPLRAGLDLEAGEAVKDLSRLGGQLQQQAPLQLDTSLGLILTLLFLVNLLLLIVLTHMLR